MGEYQTLTHTFEPVYDEHSRILILGSFPSVKSREEGFYYGHPQNRFWRMAAVLCGESTPEHPAPVTVEEKTALLKRHGLAVWDVIATCDIIGSADSSIRNAVPADIMRVLNAAPVERILVNGKTAARLYDKYLEPLTGRAALVMPSTSPANAAFSFEKLCEIWGAALKL